MPKAFLGLPPVQVVSVVASVLDHRLAQEREATRQLELECNRHVALTAVAVGGVVEIVRGTTSETVALCSAIPHLSAEERAPLIQRLAQMPQVEARRFTELEQRFKREASYSVPAGVLR